MATVIQGGGLQQQQTSGGEGFANLASVIQQRRQQQLLQDQIAQQERQMRQTRELTEAEQRLRAGELENARTMTTQVGERDAFARMTGLVENFGKMAQAAGVEPAVFLRTPAGSNYINQMWDEYSASTGRKFTPEQALGFATDMIMTVNHPEYTPAFARNWFVLQQEQDGLGGKVVGYQATPGVGGSGGSGGPVQAAGQAIAQQAARESGPIAEQGNAYTPPGWSGQKTIPGSSVKELELVTGLVLEGKSPEEQQSLLDEWNRVNGQQPNLYAVAGSGFASFPRDSREEESFYYQLTGKDIRGLNKTQQKILLDGLFSGPNGAYAQSEWERRMSLPESSRNYMPALTEIDEKRRVTGVPVERQTIPGAAQRAPMQDQTNPQLVEKANQAPSPQAVAELIQRGLETQEVKGPGFQGVQKGIVPPAAEVVRPDDLGFYAQVMKRNPAGKTRDQITKEISEFSLQSPENNEARDAYYKAYQPGDVKVEESIDTPSFLPHGAGSDPKYNYKAAPWEDIVSRARSGDAAAFAEMKSRTEGTGSAVPTTGQKGMQTYEEKQKNFYTIYTGQNPPSNPGDLFKWFRSNPDAAEEFLKWSKDPNYKLAPKKLKQSMTTPGASMVPDGIVGSKTEDEIRMEGSPFLARAVKASFTESADPLDAIDKLSRSPFFKVIAQNISATAPGVAPVEFPEAPKEVGKATEGLQDVVGKIGMGDEPSAKELMKMRQDAAVAGNWFNKTWKGMAPQAKLEYTRDVMSELANIDPNVALVKYPGTGIGESRLRQTEAQLQVNQALAAALSRQAEGGANSQELKAITDMVGSMATLEGNLWEDIRIAASGEPYKGNIPKFLVDNPQMASRLRSVQQTTSTLMSSLGVQSKVTDWEAILRKYGIFGARSSYEIQMKDDEASIEVVPDKAVDSAAAQILGGEK